MQWLSTVRHVELQHCCKHEACPGISQQRRSFPVQAIESTPGTGPAFTSATLAWTQTQADFLWACIWPPRAIKLLWAATWHFCPDQNLSKTHAGNLWEGSDWQLSPITRRNTTQTCHFNKNTSTCSDYMTVPAFSFSIGGRWVKNSLVFLHLNHTFCVELNLCKPKLVKTRLKVRFLWINWLKSLICIKTWNNQSYSNLLPAQNRFSFEIWMLVFTLNRLLPLLFIGRTRTATFTFVSDIFVQFEGFEV